MISLLIIYGPPALFLLLVAGTVYGIVRAYRKDGFRVGLDKPLFRKPTREERKRGLRRDASIGAIVVAVALLYSYFSADAG